MTDEVPPDTVEAPKPDPVFINDSARRLLAAWVGAGGTPANADELAVKCGQAYTFAEALDAERMKRGW